VVLKAKTFVDILNILSSWFEDLIDYDGVENELIKFEQVLRANDLINC
jgi:hypothetical protein